MEATRGVLQRALVAAQLPTLQHISVIGLVTIPPMMNGEVLSGTPASQVETISSCRGSMLPRLKAKSWFAMEMLGLDY